MKDRWWDWVVEVPLRVVAIVVGSLLVLVILRGLIAWLTRRLSRLPSDTDSDLTSILVRANPLAVARRRQRAHTVGSVLMSGSSLVVGTVALLLVLDELDVNLTPFLASAGIVGVGLGVGAQSLVRDLLTGLFILVEDQYGVGDVVDFGTTSGTIESVGLRVTTLRDANGSLWFVPNGSIIQVANKTQHWATATVQVDVDYFADPDQVRKALMVAAASVADDPQIHDVIQSEPAVTGIEDLTAQSIRFSVTVQTTAAQQWEVARRLRQAIRAELIDEGILWAGQRDPWDNRLVQARRDLAD